MKTGQITPDSPFGKVLTELAGESKTIFEVGTWNGLGSMLCLIKGMKPDAELISVEADPAMHTEAKENLKEFLSPRVRLIHGVLHRNIPHYWHPIDSIQHREMYEHEKKLATTMPLVVHTRPIDLLVLDGGEFTSFYDFEALGWSARCIAFDDTNPQRSVKNYYNTGLLLSDPCWSLIHDYPWDRNGWMIFKRKDQKL